MKKFNIAVVGATGMVGHKFLEVLEERKLPVNKYFLFASAKSAGSTLKFMGEDYPVLELTKDSFKENQIDIALFSAGGSTSKIYAPIAASCNVTVIDNSSQWRMDKSVPLVVPEVNPQDIMNNKGIIANPNCSTIQAVVALKPLHDKYGIKRIVYNTYQAVSGAGVGGYKDLENNIKGEDCVKFPYDIHSNVIPHIDVFLEDGYTKEELKMINETHKILHDDSIKITATAARVPVFHSHSESINVELEKEFDVKDIFELYKNTPGIILKDDVDNLVYPMAKYATGNDEVFVGRIRRDKSVENGLNLWVVADNIRKGAATNAVQIAEIVIKNMQEQE